MLPMTGESHTAKEIFSQPQLWRETYESVRKRKDEIASFLKGIYETDHMRILLTGAGSSAFVGEILQYSFHRNTGLMVKAVPTTDLVTHPADFFQGKDPILLISFARSGDSPESLAAAELAERLNDRVYHLVITCNPRGNLVRRAAEFKRSFVFLLPEAANDLALAMTSSFTCMTLAGLLISDINRVEANAASVEKLIALGEIILKQYDMKLDAISKLDFKRIVFLGSGPLKGTAKESHLKAIELTDGAIVCQYDSFLGFRHGPKAIINESTLLVYIFSSDPYVSGYEVDLVRSINQTEHFSGSIGIGQYGKAHQDLELDLSIDLRAGECIPDDFFAICSVLPAQILGYYKSVFLGLTPDSPSQNGGIHRIVQGVTIYPYQNP